MENSNRKWALILGGSSGLGLATAQKLAFHGFNLLILHRDRRSELDKINQDFQYLRDAGARVISYNVDATSPVKQKEIIEDFTTQLHEKKVAVLVHSIAKGNLKPMNSDDGEHTLQRQDFELTLSAMALSLYDWVKALVSEDLFEKDTRIVAFTSEGSSKVIPKYAAVSLAKVALENLVKSIAVEFAPIGIKANCIQAGVTDTRSFRMIPDSDKIAKEALKRNPGKRLTLPEDVANVVYLLTTEEAKWVTGNTIKVDGGESLC